MKTFIPLILKEFNEERRNDRENVCTACGRKFKLKEIILHALHNNNFYCLDCGHIYLSNYLNGVHKEIEAVRELQNVITNVWLAMHNISGMNEETARTIVAEYKEGRK